MNIHELDSYDLGDAVKFNNRLNPRIWGADEKMRPEVREQLLRIADDFQEFLGIDVEIKDITVSGSNAAYTYTPHSDIDLHLVVDLPEADRNEVYRELFDAKKYAYNDMHDIRIGGYDVELYVQDANKKHHSQGIYSIMNDDWVSVPRRRRPDVDDISVKSKFEDLGHRIETAIKSQDYEKISAMAEKIRDYRQAGLDAHGEFGPENLAFKILRTQGLIKKLYDARAAAKDELLSLDERRKKKKKKSVRYGYGGYWYPGTAYAGQDHPAGTEGGDGGGGDGGGESIRESVETADENILRDFIEFCVKQLKIEQMPRVKLRRDPQWSTVHKTFGRYNNDTKTLEVAWGNRHIMDVLRTVAHELTHTHQHEREGHRMGADAGETGSPYENEANARAGVLMRNWAGLHPEHFEADQANNLEEGWKQNVATGVLGATMALGAVSPARAEIANMSPVQVQQSIKRAELAKKYTEVLIQRAKEDGRPIDTRMMNAIKAKASDMAAKQLQNQSGAQQTQQQSNFPAQGSERIVSPNYNKFEESASGYIPTKKQARDPRFSMALTVDVKPGQVGKEANKLKLKTDRQGAPQIARADGLFENLFKEYKQYKTDEDYSPDEPPGPEFKPTMPKGTLRVDVSDVYDWYKLGQHISNMKGLGQHDFGQGPPGAIISFGDEDTEHKFIDDLKATGLDVTDLDPVDPVKRPGKKIKTDPTYNVDEVIQTPVAKGKDAEQYYKFIVGKARMGRPLTRAEQDYVKMYQMYRQQKLAEGAADHVRMVMSRAADIMKQRGFRAVGQLSDQDLEKIARETDATPHDVAIILNIDHAHEQTVAEYATTPDRDDDTQGPDYIEQLANRWWNAADPVKQDRIAAVLRTFGYAISQVESEDDAVQLTDIKSGHTYFISADDFDPDLFESVELDEVNMSPGALEKFAASKEAQGIRAGFEAELIFRDTQGDDEDEYDMEPDYDMDERAYSIQQVIEFFSNDDWGYGLSDRQIRSLENELDEQYMTWRDEQMMEEFRNEAEDLVRKVIEDEEWDWDDAVRNQLDDMGLSNDEIEEAMRVGRTAGRFNSSKEQEAYAKENPGYQRYLEAYSAAESILDDLVEESVKEQDKYYDAALDDFRDNWSGDDDSFFSDVGMRWMSDIANNFGLDWPYMTGGGNSNNGSRSWDEIGNELQAVVGMPVKVSSNYHSTARKEGQWIIEPDGSLSPDDKSDEAGLEIVSPPMPLLMAIAKLKEVTDWANDPNGGNAYTNGSTGLHMGVSLPRIRAEDDNDRAGIDYVKLILFMGDKYVLEKFGREANTYTASALEKFKQNIRGGRSDPAGVVKLLKHGLTELAYRELQKGVGTSKYTSAHIQNGYIEFRSPGGDWLAKADEEIGVLENTMLRFARAMQIAGDPAAERQEYAKKLYKLVTADNEQYADQLRLFSEYSAGTIDKEQLKKQWAEKTIGTEKKANQRWKLYQKSNGTWTPVPGGEWNGYTEDQVKNAVWSKYGREALDSGEYQLVNMGEQEWEVYDVKTGKTLEIVKGKSKGEVADAVFDKYANQGIGFNVRAYEDPAKLTPRAKLAKRIVTKPKTATQYNYDIVDQRTVELRVVDQFRAETPAEAERVYSAWLKSKDLPDDTANYGYRKNEQAADDQRDSVDIQRTLGIQDVDTDVAQNFSPDYSAFERNSDRIDAIRARQDATDVPRNWEFVNRINGQVIHNMTNASYNQANVVQNNLESRYPDADIYLRSVERSN